MIKNNTEIIAEQTHLLLERYKQYFDTDACRDLNKMPCHKEENYWELNENGYPVQYTKCVKCNEFKPRIPVYFILNHLCNNYTDWLNKTKIGCEYFYNSNSSPCKQCRGIRETNKKQTDSNIFWGLMGNRYGMNGNELKKLFDNQTIGPISGVLCKYMIQCSHSNLTVGVHDLERSHMTTDAKYYQKNHKIEHIVLDFAFINVAQRTKIDSLKICTIDSYKQTCIYVLNSDTIPEEQNYIDETREWYSKTAKEVDVPTMKKNDINSVKMYYKELDAKYLPRILSNFVRRSNVYDNRAKRDNDIPREEHIGYLLDTLFSYKHRCDVCKVLLTIQKNKWADLSFDRIDNSKGHFVKGNLRPVCSLHQIPGGQNRHHNYATHLHMILLQQHFELDNDTRVAIQSEHDSIDQKNKFETCHLCELDI